MVRAVLRVHVLVCDKRNHDQVIDIVMREMKPIDALLADESRAGDACLTKDGSVKSESIEVLIDLVREKCWRSRARSRLIRWWIFRF